MNILDEREQAAEKEYVMKRERSFRIKAKRDRMLAQWAADLLGRQDVDTYFDEIVAAGLTELQDRAVFSKVWSDLQSAQVSIDKKGLREKMRQLLHDAEQTGGSD